MLWPTELLVHCRHHMLLRQVLCWALYEMWTQQCAVCTRRDLYIELIVVSGLTLFSSALFHRFNDDEAATWCFHLFLSHTRTIACCTVNFFASISSFTLLSRDAQAKLALIVAQCLSIHLCVCPRQLESSVCTQHCASRATSTTGLFINFFGCLPWFLFPLI